MNLEEHHQLLSSLYLCSSPPSRLALALSLKHLGPGPSFVISREGAEAVSRVKAPPTENRPQATRLRGIVLK